MQLSSTAVLAGLSGKITGNQLSPGNVSLIEAATSRVGVLPRRKLGYSGREVSIIIGAGDMSPAVTEAAVKCGINYWHKANRWMREGVPDIIMKNREEHYCQVTVDRVDGNHYEGRLDEDEHYNYVKTAVKETGLGYFDDMQLHYGYHNVEELKNDRSFIRAFERLKKEGLVKHLCLSQHSYAGSPRVENGESAAKILTEIIKDGHYEHAQFMYSYDDDPEMDEFIKYASENNFGTTAMKTARGLGRMKQDSAFMSRLPDNISPHNALVRWLTTETPLDNIVLRVRNMSEFEDSYSGAGKKPGQEDMQALNLVKAEANKNACRLCGKCQSACPQHIPITDIFRFERYAMDDHDWEKAAALYDGLPVKGNICTSCNTCTESCPLNLDIPVKLEKIHTYMS